MEVLKIDNLSKRYGRTLALNELNLSIQKGQVYGLLGPNGSGKTTTLGIILGVTSKTSGSFSWLGRGEDYEIRKKIGAILERPVFYESFSGRKNLEVTCEIKQVNYDIIEKVLELVDLKGRENDAFKKYSLGMKQRLAIASAMICDPDILILDEPTNGLDPMGIAQIRKIIRNIADSGKTIILASHLLDEVQKVCTDFCVLQKGNLIHQGPVNDASGNETVIEVGAEDIDNLVSALEGFPKVKAISKQYESVSVHLPPHSKALELNQFLSSKGIVVNHLVAKNQSLEDKFLEILKETK